MTVPVTTNKLLAKQDTGTNRNTWGTYLNENFELLDLALGGVATLSTTGGTKSLNANQAACLVLKVTGTLTSDTTILYPEDRGGFYSIENDTTGAFAVLVGCSAGGLKVTIPQGQKRTLTLDGAHARVLDDAVDEMIAALDASTIPYTAPFTGAAPRTIRAKLSETCSPMDFGCIGDADVNDTVNFMKGADALQAAGGGRYIIDRYYAVDKVTYGAGVIFEGVTPYKSGIIGKYNTSGPVVAAADAEAFINTRVTASVALSVGVAVNVALRNVTKCRVGDRLVIYKETDAYALCLINSVNTGASTVNVTPQSIYNSAYGNLSPLAAGDIAWNIDNVGSEFGGVRNLYIEGSRDTAAGLQNVCLPQTRGSAGALTLNGSMVWGDGSARAAFGHNTRLRLASNADNTGITFSLEWLELDQHGTPVTRSETIAGPGAGEAKCVYFSVAGNRIVNTTKLTCSGPISGNVWAGMPTLGDGAGLLHFGPTAVNTDLVIQYCRGWGYEHHWIYPVLSWTSDFKTQLAEAARIQTFCNDGGGLYIDCIVDGRFRDIVVNQCENELVHLTRYCPGSKIIGGHLSAGAENSTRFQRPFFGAVIEADNCEIDLPIEGASDANVALRSNNVDLRGRLFDNVDNAQLGGAHWIANRRNTSPFASVGVQVGDSALGWAATGNRIDIKTEMVSAAHVYLANDGGENRIRVKAQDQYTALTAAIAAGATFIPLASMLKVTTGQPLHILLDSGAYESVTISSITNKTATVTTPVASPGQVNWTAHGLVAGSPVVFTTTGALPTGLTAGTVYYVIAAGLATDSFRVAATPGGAAINFTGSTSGTHTGKAIYVVISPALSGAAAAATNEVCRGKAISGSTYGGVPVQYRTRISINGRGVDTPEYRFNWHEQRPTFQGTVTIRKAGYAFQQLVEGASTTSSGYLATFTGAGTRVAYSDFYDGAKMVDAVEGATVGKVFSINGTVRATMAPEGLVKLGGGFARGKETVITGTSYTVADDISVVICTNAGGCTITLPTGTLTSGFNHTDREIEIINEGAGSIISASANVRQLTGAVSNALCGATSSTKVRAINTTDWRKVR